MAIPGGKRTWIPLLILSIAGLGVGLFFLIRMALPKNSHRGGVPSPAPVPSPAEGFAVTSFAPMGGAALMTPTPAGSVRAILFNGPNYTGASVTIEAEKFFSGSHTVFEGKLPFTVRSIRMPPRGWLRIMNRPDGAEAGSKYPMSTVFTANTPAINPPITINEEDGVRLFLPTIEGDYGGAIIMRTPGDSTDFLGVFKGVMRPDFPIVRTGADTYKFNFRDDPTCCTATFDFRGVIRFNNGTKWTRVNELDDA